MEWINVLTGWHGVGRVGDGGRPEAFHIARLYPHIVHVALHQVRNLIVHVAYIVQDLLPGDDTEVFEAAPLH